MISPRNEPSVVPDTGFIEKKARYLMIRWSARGRGPPAGNAQKRAVLRAAAAGMVSGGLIGIAEVYVIRGLLPREDAGFLDHIGVWSAFLVFAGLVSAIEILFLYWSALRAGSEIAARARLKGRENAGDVFRGLARAAFEFPEPPDPVFGIDPYARIPGWRITARRVLYRLKVGVSSLLVRLFLRRVAGRMIVRSVLPLIAAPLYAVWNALITLWIMRELRVRAFGPPAIARLMETLDSEQPVPSHDEATIMLDGTAEMLMRGCDAHPNHVLLLARLKERAGIGTDTLDADWTRARNALAGLDDAARLRVIDVLSLAAATGSKVRQSQERLLHEASEICGETFRPEALRELRKNLMEGSPAGRRDLSRASGSGPTRAASEAPAVQPA